MPSFRREGGSGVRDAQTDAASLPGVGADLRRHALMQRARARRAERATEAVAEAAPILRKAVADVRDDSPDERFAEATRGGGGTIP